MKTSNEKEKKLTLALNKLENINLANPVLKNSLENLGEQRNQLEIEKKEIEKKYQLLMRDYEKLKQKLEEVNINKEKEKRKELEFTEKIDELNQETDTLMEEIDKWQM
tara:strand:- start:200 stop:523 length:324 start_codon:yes stop_codon:yes gene_type:complete